MCYTSSENLTVIDEGTDEVMRRFPRKRSHRKRIVPSVMNSKLLFEIIERKELVSCIKVFIIFSVRAFNFAVMPGSIRANEFVVNMQSGGSNFK